jgi:hypothetical protein
LGVSRGSIDNAEQHVDIAEQYPFMAGKNWAQYHVLNAAALLERFEELEREQMVEVIDDPLIRMQRLCLSL